MKFTMKADGSVIRAMDKEVITEDTTVVCGQGGDEVKVMDIVRMVQKIKNTGSFKVFRDGIVTVAIQQGGEWVTVELGVDLIGEDYKIEDYIPQ